MLKKIKLGVKKNLEIFALGLLIAITIAFTSYYNFNKEKIFQNYSNLLDNVYFKKSINQIFDNLEPRFKKIEHEINVGETFDKILEEYLVEKSEIKEIKKELNKKINLNKLNVNQKIYFTIDQTNSKVKEFVFQISNTEKIYLTRKKETNKFDPKIIVTKLNKKIIYDESVILESLYKSASNQKVPANIIIEFARIYGFQVDFQRDIRKKDKFQIINLDRQKTKVLTVRVSPKDVIQEII